jgi:hypothetical protein
MTLAEVQQRATALGFTWRVQPDRLMDPTVKTKHGPNAVGHIICHEPDNGNWICQNFSDATSFGAMFSSYACNIFVKNGVLEKHWFFMD